ncbi:DUF2254 domain-containing protein [Gordonia sp. CPCC 205515]|uniref:DUF2254 domain-containing protein n=1 Tax=Gordonia sp. CPCC 205515 TaxID=3140791 RepID=UPI003AF3A536
MRIRFARLRDAFWFVPLLLVIAGIVLAEVLVAVDRHLNRHLSGGWGLLTFHVGVSGGRDILGTIGGSMLAVAATSFSITISVLATASSTYGPRLVRNFMNDRGNQVVLGMFGATFVYSLMVLRSIRGGASVEADFVPDLAINVAVLLAVIDVLVLVYFINHIAASIQVSTLSARVRSELDAVVTNLYPAEQPDNAQAAPTPAGGRAIIAKASGFVVGIDETRLLRTAGRCDAILAVRVRPGDHVVSGDVIASVHPSDPHTGNVDDDTFESVETTTCRTIELGDTRTPHQDIQFAVQQLTEMAVRAVSPGTNDPYTAHNALNELAAGLVPLVRRPTPDLGRVDSDGTVRLIVTRLPATELIDDVFNAMRTYALDAPIAMTAAILLARRLGQAAHDDVVRDRVMHHLELIDASLSRVEDRENAEFMHGEIVEARQAVIAAASSD